MYILFLVHPIFGASYLWGSLPSYVVPYISVSYFCTSYFWFFLSLRFPFLTLWFLISVDPMFGVSYFCVPIFVSSYLYVTLKMGKRLETGLGWFNNNNQAIFLRSGLSFPTVFNIYYIWGGCGSRLSGLAFLTVFVFNICHETQLTNTRKWGKQHNQLHCRRPAIQTMSKEIRNTGLIWRFPIFRVT